jgi:translation initiation factor IF-3
VIGPEGEQLGILSLEAALARAAESGFDLVEVSPMAKPPVCKIMDYGRFKYSEKKKQNKARKTQFVAKIKEIKLRPRTDEHDYDVKLRQAREFLEEGHKVKVTIVFRGREIAHRDIGQKQLQEMLVDLKEVGQVEQPPRSEGKTMFMLLGAGTKAKPAPVSRPVTAGPPRPPGAPSATGAPPANRPPSSTPPKPTFQPAGASAAAPTTQKPTFQPAGASSPPPPTPATAAPAAAPAPAVSKV